MPGFDGTGPNGQGPMTGGARGYCALPAGQTAAAPIAGARVGRGLGLGYGRGLGRGFRRGGRGFYRQGYVYSDAENMSQATVDEIAALKAQNTELAKAVEKLNSRLEELGKDGK